MSKLLVVLCLFLAACGGPPGQRVIEWRNADRLFLGDARNGVVRVFDTRNGPVPYGQLNARERHSVRDMQFDPAKARLWVLGDDALYLYDARLLVLVERYALPFEGEAWLELDAGKTGVTLVSAQRRKSFSAREG